MRTPALPLGGAKGEEAPPRATVLGEKKIQAPPMGGVRSLDLSRDPTPVKTPQSEPTAEADPERGRSASEWGGVSPRLERATLPRRDSSPSQSGFCRGRFSNQILWGRLGPELHGRGRRCRAEAPRQALAEAPRTAVPPPGRSRAWRGGRRGRSQSPGGARGAEGRGL